MFLPLGPQCFVVWSVSRPRDQVDELSLFRAVVNVHESGPPYLFAKSLHLV